MTNNVVPVPPSLTGGAIQVTRRIQTLVPCPGCRRDLDITSVTVGALIKCPECQNATWAPDYVPHWWHRTRNFVLSVVVAFVVGVCSSLLAEFVLRWFTSADGTKP